MPTPNLDLEQPNFGSSNWHTPLNDNFDKIDALAATGTIGARPAAASFGVGYYFATDDDGGTFYRSDGAAWSQVAPGVAEPSGTVIARATTSVATLLSNASPHQDVGNVGQLSVPITTRAWEFVIHIPGVTHTGGGTGNIAIALTDGTIIANFQITTGSAAVSPFVVHYPMDALGTATTYKLMAHRGATAGNLNLNGGTTGAKWGWHARLD